MDVTITYTQAVEQWATERELLRYVEPFTAKKAKQKALLFGPWIGEKPLDEISKDNITVALARLSATGGRHGTGLSSATLRAAHLAGSQAFDWAISHGHANTNPFGQVRRPKANYRLSQFLTSPQAASISSQFTEEMHAYMLQGNVCRSGFCLAACIALATGMRRGEIFALTWDDYDPVRMRISISKAIKAGGSLGAPKSRSSIRNVGIGAGLAAMLEEYRAWQESRMEATMGHGPRPMISNAEGARANLNAFGHWWRRWADANGYEGLRFHELRHTHATLLIANGTDVKTVQMHLGHSSAEVTMSIYAHAIPLADSNAAKLLDAELFG